MSGGADGRGEWIALQPIPAAPRDHPLGHMTHAINIAEILMDEKLKMPLSVGIYGAKGLGKTWLLDKIKEKTNIKVREQNRPSAPDDGTPFPRCLLIILIIMPLAFFLFLAATITTGIYGRRPITTPETATPHPNTTHPNTMHPTTMHSNTTSPTILSPCLWTAFLPLTLLAFLSFLLAILFACNVCKLRSRSSPMHWILGIYLDLIDPPCIDPPQDPPQHPPQEVIWVDFNAWEFSGCKVLWAGIVTTLCDAIERQFGKWPPRFYRCIMGKVEKQTNKRSICGRVWFKIVLWVTIAVLLTTTVLLVVFLVGIEEIHTAVLSTLGALFGIGSLAALWQFVPGAITMVTGIYRSQKKKLDAKMQRPNFAEQLGFMSLVKKEVQLVTSLLRFLGRVLRVQYRVVIMIDDLDCCAADRVVGVLEAMKILLSDEDANFITVLAVDQKTIVSCLREKLPRAVPTESSGYAYLKRIVRFSVGLSEVNVTGREEMWRQTQERDLERRGETPEVERFLDGVVGIMQYVPGNALHISSLYYVLRMTVHIINNRGMLGSFEPRQVASWVVLVGQWPWRMGWVEQYVEDEEQRANTEGDMYNGVQRQTTLNDVYSLVQEEMMRDTEGWSSFNSQDGDPELFKQLLEESGFTVQDMLNLLPCTVNFNYCIKQTIAAARGLSLE